jgi:hypothetical protein
MSRIPVDRENMMACIEWVVGRDIMAQLNMASRWAMSRTAWNFDARRLIATNERNEEESIRQYRRPVSNTVGSGGTLERTVLLRANPSVSTCAG